MSPGTRRPAPRRAITHLPLGKAFQLRWTGGCIFAERPEFEAPVARILWHADLDPATLQISVVPVRTRSVDALSPGQLAPWLTVVRGPVGEHAVLSDGWHHIRLDIEDGSLLAADTAILHYRLAGLASAAPKILSLRRLIDLLRHRTFSRTLYPRDRRIERWLAALRVHDALAAGASQSDIAHELYGAAGRDRDGSRADSLRSRVRRLAADARRLSNGGYRRLMLGGSAGRD